MDEWCAVGPPQANPVSACWQLQVQLHLLLSHGGGRVPGLSSELPFTSGRRGVEGGGGDQKWGVMGLEEAEAILDGREAHAAANPGRPWAGARFKASRSAQQ